MLEVCRLEAERSDQVLFRNITFSLEPGQWCWVEGQNGSGKTTLLKMLAGLIPIGEGYGLSSARNTGASLKWRGSKVSRFEPYFLQDLLYLGHRPALHPALSPLENLKWLASLHLQPSGTAKTAMLNMGLSAIEIHQPTGQLSFGQQQRISLARLLLTRASLWILDEPTTGLDTKGQTIMQSCLHQHLASGGIAVIASHGSLAEVQRPDHKINLQSFVCNTIS